MMLIIDLFDETEQLDKQIQDNIKSLLQHAAEEEQIGQDAELTVTFVNNEKIQQVNAEYRGIDQPTDVISFALEDQVEGEVQVIGAPTQRILGDIILSVEKAKEQAGDYGHSFMRELGFLVVHGFLHLLGYDHTEEDEEKEMFKRQEAILGSFGLTRS
ncbi:rRNA maturation RNase YbeY [Alkalihalobacillus sp. AL-G]|uniref:rRNA maturation RNase YbeY n=1 Tax=Alkalihalobacillus sp. AL-G TaxID=2926399 RepID=UPI00272C0D88|nr:rRNA maturation RNase YbeY [Alkalihalobacillus sp. AL-G]WLD92121.1 rRNA maturation RNase YbeY [Alkalihalobacillus sp. AL-G]